MTNRTLLVRILEADGTIGWANIPDPRVEYCRRFNELHPGAHAEIPDDEDSLILDLDDDLLTP